MHAVARHRHANIGALGWVGIGLGVLALGVVGVAGVVFYRMTKM